MRSATISFVLLMGVLGCGGSDSTSNTGGVPRGTALKDLTRNDLVSLCKANEAKLESLGSCSTAGLEENTQAECQAVVSECEKSTTASYSDADCDGASTSDIANCTVSVGEFADCLDELQSYLGSLSCKDAGKPLVPPSCFSSVSTKCPGLFDD